jgi:hypothetical protein
MAVGTVSCELVSAGNSLLRRICRQIPVILNLALGRISSQFLEAQRLFPPAPDEPLSVEQGR